MSRREKSETAAAETASPAPAAEVTGERDRRVVDVSAADDVALTADPVALPITYGQIRAIVHGVLESLPEGTSVLAQAVADYMLARPPTFSVEQLTVEAEAAVARALDARTENLKADIIAHLTPMVTAVVSGKAAPAPPTLVTSSSAPIGLKPADPVKVWGDPEHKSFRLGEIVAAHDGGHAFDVRLDDDTVTKVPADGLDYDDRR